MTRNAFALAFLVLLLASCDGSTKHTEHAQAGNSPANVSSGDESADETSDEPGAKPVDEASDASGNASKDKPASARPGPHGLTIDGEHFTVRTVVDRQQGGIPVCVFVAPERWPDQSQVVWNYEHNANPVTAAVKVENPANDEAFYLYPTVDLFWLRPVTNYYRPGQNVGGLMFAAPMRPDAALWAFVQQARQGFAGMHLVGSKDLPSLPEALRLPPSPKQRGVGLKISYELKGRPVEEEFYAVSYSIDIPYDGPQGRTWQNNWGLKALHSFRAPRGTLDKRRPVFAAIVKSFRPNPAWQKRVVAINAYLADQFNRQLQAGYDQIAAAGRLSRQISANNDAMLSAIDSRLQASARAPSGSAGSSARTSSDHFDDYIRGVDTTDDPYYGTSQHSNTESYHWTDGYGSYRNSNDATYNPNQNENGNWQMMQPAR
ncbi:MAG: hypothetical protein ABI885_09685 [Gammaproteobacteria bacterium]